MTHLTHQQIYNPYQTLKPKSPIKKWLLTIGLTLWVATAILAQTGSDDNEPEAETKTAFFPAKPAHAVQVAYREDAREQLRLRDIK